MCSTIRTQLGAELSNDNQTSTGFDRTMLQIRTGQTGLGGPMLGKMLQILPAVEEWITLRMLTGVGQIWNLVTLMLGAFHLTIMSLKSLSNLCVIL